MALHLPVRYIDFHASQLEVPLDITLRVSRDMQLGMMVHSILIIQVFTIRNEYIIQKLSVVKTLFYGFAMLVLAIYEVHMSNGILMQEYSWMV